MFIKSLSTRSIRFLSLFGALLFAWSGNIHRAVVLDAETQLSMEARVRIHALLGPLPLAYWASWADQSKDYPKFWHYMAIENIEDACETRPQNIRCALERLSKVSSQDLWSEPDRIRLLLHLVVDAHQPLHVDRPGFSNTNCWVLAPKKICLHQWMDQAALGVPQASAQEIQTWIAAQREAMKIRTETPRVWLLENQDEWVWIYPKDSALIPYYCLPGAKDLPRLSQKQQAKIAERSLKRLAQSSVRLAFVLNQLYGKGQDAFESDIKMGA